MPVRNYAGITQCHTLLLANNFNLVFCIKIEEAMEDNGVVSSIVQFCSVNEARYIMENLIATTINKAVFGVQTQNRVSLLVCLFFFC